MKYLFLVILFVINFGVVAYHATTEDMSPEVLSPFEIIEVAVIIGLLMTFVIGLPILGLVYLFV